METYFGSGFERYLKDLGITKEYQEWINAIIREVELIANYDCMPIKLPNGKEV